MSRRRRCDHADVVRRYVVDGEGVVAIALGERQGIAECLEGLACVAMLTNKSEPAVRLFGAAQALREAIGAPLPAADQPTYDRSLAAAAATVADSMADAAWTIGRAMTHEQAVAYALRVVDQKATRSIQGRNV